MFQDRDDAARRLLARLPALNPETTVVMALPRGGVPLGRIIADGLGAPLDVVFVRKVGVPGHRELAVAAVTDGPAPALSVNRDVARMEGLSDADIRALAEPELAEIARRRKLWQGTRRPLPVRDRTVVVVDDGIATGATMRAALDWLRAEGAARLILAVPVAAEETLAELAARVDQAICLETPRPFYAVGAHYRSFPQVTDTEVTEALARDAGPDRTS